MWFGHEISLVWRAHVRIWLVDLVFEGISPALHIYCSWYSQLENTCGRAAFGWKAQICAGMFSGVQSLSKDLELAVSGSCWQPHITFRFFSYFHTQIPSNVEKYTHTMHDVGLCFYIFLRLGKGTRGDRRANWIGTHYHRYHRYPVNPPLPCKGTLIVNAPQVIIFFRYMYYLGRVDRVAYISSWILERHHMQVEPWVMDPT